jgi:RNA polymerase sigma factor (sigma-70 family)
MIDYNDDDQLADAVQRGDIAAQEAFFTRFQLRLIKFAMSKGFSAEDAEEVAQDALATGFRTIASFRRGEFLVRWLVGIEVNFMRRRWAERTPGEMVPLDEAEDLAATRQRLEELSPQEAKNLGRLWADLQMYMSLAPNETYMDAVRLRHLDKLEYTEIEAILGLGKNTAKVYVQRGLKYLKEAHEVRAPEDPPRT